MSNQNGLPIKPISPPDARTEGPNSGPNAVRVQSYPGVRLYGYVESVRTELKEKNKKGVIENLGESQAVKKMIAFCFHHHAEFMAFWKK